jgi:hypothetical protein
MPPQGSSPSTVTSKPLTAPPGKAVRAALALRRALLRAADKVVPAHRAMFERVVAANGAPVLGELARLGVPDLLAEQPMTAAELAGRTNTNADAMQRSLRAAIVMGIFERLPDGRFTNNRLSNALRSGDVESTRAFATYFGSPANLQAWADYRETLRTGASAFERVHGVSVWDWYDRHPDERETFARAMMGMTLLDAPGIAQAYPFAEVGTLCDVGGGRGTLLSELLLHHPKLRAKLCDMPGVLESAKELLGKRGVVDRVELVPGSFFESVPKGADAYLLKNILHDWDDERAVKILKTCRDAMLPQNRLLVVELLVEDGSEDFRNLVDLQMMVSTVGGRERSRTDFERLFGATGFQISRTFPTPTGMSVIEALAI